MPNKVLVTGPFHTLSPDGIVSTVDGAVVQLSSFSPDANKVIQCPDFATAKAFSMLHAYDPNTGQRVKFAYRVDAYASMVLADNPVGYWRLGETSGSYADQMGLSPLASIGAGVTRGVTGLPAGDPDKGFSGIGGATSFVSSAAPIPSLAFPGTAPFSVDLWLSTTATTGSAWFLFSNRATTGSLDGWQASVDVDGNTQFIRSDSTTAENTFLGTPAIVHDGNPHHMAFIFTGDHLQIWLDGVQKISSARSKVIGSSGGNFAIGNVSTPTAGNGWLGTLDEVAVYGYALSEAQIHAHYIAGLVGP